MARQMDVVQRAVRERGYVDFFDLCRDYDRSGIIATFLAILELIRQRLAAARLRTVDAGRTAAAAAVSADRGARELSVAK